MSLPPIACGGCRACCVRDKITLREEDDHTQYQWHWEADPRRPEAFPDRVLDRKADGSCTYLDKTGCSIHDRAPSLCKQFDCRVLFLQTSKQHRRIRIEQNPTMRDVYQAGRTRIQALPK